MSDPYLPMGCTVADINGPVDTSEPHPTCETCGEELVRDKGEWVCIYEGEHDLFNKTKVNDERKRIPRS